MRIARQPNGKYFIEHNGQRYINQTEDDYYNFVLEDAREKLNTLGYIDGINFVIQRLTSDEEAKEMGFDKPVKELIRLVPLPVVNNVCPKCGQRLSW